ncbi:MAG: hypothetical protein ACOX4Q_03135 [Syntrophomonadales bacterium]|jgi:hypothetical protein
MKVPLVHELNELIETDILLRECLGPWDEHLQGYRKDLNRVIHWTALPAITVAVNRRFDGHDRFGSHMAAIFTIMYLADHIHNSIRDDEEGKTSGAQFSILIGDYLFSKAIGLLDRIDSHNLLQYFSQMMCTINEGHVLRKLAEGKPDLEILGREKASYYKYSFLTAAAAGGSGALECRFYGETGFNLGMAITLYDEGLDKVALSYLEKTRVLLSSWNRPRDDKICVIRSLSEELIQSIKPTREVVAI